VWAGLQSDTNSHGSHCRDWYDNLKRVPQKGCTEPLGLLRQVIKTIDKAIPGDSIKFSLKQDHDNLRLRAAVEANLGDALKYHIDLRGRVSRTSRVASADGLRPELSIDLLIGL